jgi:hypothetical protein
MTTMPRSLLAVLLGSAITLPASAQPPAEFSPAEMMQRADTDGDGKVSLDEFIKARTARLEEAFARMDTDGDGSLDEKEAEAAAEQMRSMMPGGREGFRRPDGPRGGRPGMDRPQRPEGERPQRPGGGAFGEQAFDRFDGDGDGTLSREEFVEGSARLREFMQRGGPGPGGPGRPDRGGRGPAEGFRRPPQQD